MIGQVKKEAGGQVFELKLSAGAMMRIEEKFNAPISGVLQSLGDSPPVTKLFQLLAEVLDAGRGVSIGEAADFVDEVGVPAAMEILGLACEKAFPEAPAGNRPAPAKGAP